MGYLAKLATLAPWDTLAPDPPTPLTPDDSHDGPTAPSGTTVFGVLGLYLGCIWATFGPIWATLGSI